MAANGYGGHRLISLPELTHAPAHVLIFIHHPPAMHKNERKNTFLSEERSQIRRCDCQFEIDTDYMHIHDALNIASHTHGCV